MGGDGLGKILCFHYNSRCMIRKSPKTHLKYVIDKYSPRTAGQRLAKSLTPFFQPPSEISLLFCSLFRKPEVNHNPILYLNDFSSKHSSNITINSANATQPVPGNNTLAANLMARAWNSSTELHTVTTLGAAKLIARKWAQNLLVQ